MAIEAELLNRMKNVEDRLTERKLEGVSSRDIKKTVIAFANSVPINRSGVLYIGISSDGLVKGVAEPDSLQRTIRNLTENECYPPIYVDLVSLSVEGISVLAVNVPPSSQRPHFAGAAFVRRGSESIAATAQLLDELIFSRNDLRRTLLEGKDQVWTVAGIGKQVGRVPPMGSNYTEQYVARIEEVTAHYVRLLIDGNRWASEPLDNLRLSFDDQNHRPMLIVRYTP